MKPIMLIALRPVHTVEGTYTTGQPRSVDSEKQAKKMIDSKRWKKATKKDLAAWKQRANRLVTADAAPDISEETPSESETVSQTEGNGADDQTSSETPDAETPETEAEDTAEAETSKPPAGLVG